MIKLLGISKTYSKNKDKAVENLSLEINNGEIFGFLGPNGAGKTTTIKMMTGIIGADEGSIEIDNISLQKNPISAKRQFSFVPDNPETFSKLKAIEYLDFICDVYKVKQEDKLPRINEYTERFGIKNVLNDKIGSFSHGMKQKLFLTASLITDPQNWILDEPMVGLDPEASFIVKEIMRARAKSGKTVFFSTHVMEVAEKLCDRIGIIKKGKILFIGKIDELRNQFGSNDKDESLEQIFLQLVKEN